MDRNSATAARVALLLAAAGAVVACGKGQEAQRGETGVARTEPAASDSAPAVTPASVPPGRDSADSAAAPAPRDSSAPPTARDAARDAARARRPTDTVPMLRDSGNDGPRR